MLAALRLPSGRRSRQTGLSIVEMMVGVTVGLFVVAGAAMMVGSQLAGNRLLVLDTQLQQDLRATADIIARELRRSGALQDSVARRTLWYPEMPVAPITNFAATVMEPSAGPSSTATFSYQRDPAVGDYGFELLEGRIRARPTGGWQDLTDRNVMRVTGFTITPVNDVPTVIPCPDDCPGGGQACWPTVQTRSYTVVIDAQAANDASVTRSIRSTVRVRSDLVRTDPSITSGICPPAP